jgi:hypothetical protein
MQGTKVDPGVTSLGNHQNILIPIEFSLYSLQGAKIQHKSRGELKIKDEPLRVSNHYLTDMVHAVSCSEINPEKFHWLSLVYESIVYKTNPQVEDPPGVEDTQAAFPVI